MHSGWLNINKPAGMTSAHVLNRLKRVFPRGFKIGHAGTLDKFACGVLPVALGHATKTIPLIMDAQKAYVFKVNWGVQTETDDPEGAVIGRSDVMPTLQNIGVTLQKFRGSILQMPPVYSALKVEGVRASDRVRKGQDVELAAREIHIYELDVVEHSETETTFRVVCSKGTYVRALARDLAAELGTLGYVSYLQRERVGSFSLDDSIFLENDFKIDYDATVKIMSAIIPIRTVLDDIPAVSCTESAILRLSKGQSISVSLQDSEFVFAVDDNDVIAIGYVKDLVFYPRNVFINGV
jgi:tRNA pseudouridine55 synthase